MIEEFRRGGEVDGNEKDVSCGGIFLDDCGWH